MLLVTHILPFVLIAANYKYNQYSDNQSYSIRAEELDADKRIRLENSITHSPNQFKSGRYIIQDCIRTIKPNSKGKSTESFESLAWPKCFDELVNTRKVFKLALRNHPKRFTTIRTDTTVLEATLNRKVDAYYVETMEGFANFAIGNASKPGTRATGFGLDHYKGTYETNLKIVLGLYNESIAIEAEPRIQALIEKKKKANPGKPIDVDKIKKEVYASAEIVDIKKANNVLQTAFIGHMYTYCNFYCRIAAAGVDEKALYECYSLLQTNFIEVLRYLINEQKESKNYCD